MRVETFRLYKLASSLVDHAVVRLQNPLTRKKQVALILCVTLCKILTLYVIYLYIMTHILVSLFNSTILNYYFKDKFIEDFIISSFKPNQFNKTANKI